ncbi:conserved hypothetical protein [Xenorhabdus cabanillasii JM26]|uniref:Uncharacterized protein n=1 Tax=Xenorhabdus cabanillasii JM26 TaxID=1427517 RepID=W1JB39_9GAMM|nr:conserved hypothetical protein [Xenorhabdus cabanillasii JM26]
MKAFGLTEEVHRKPGDLSAEEDSGTPCVAVERVDIWKNTSGEGGCLVCNVTLRLRKQWVANRIDTV